MYKNIISRLFAIGFGSLAATGALVYQFEGEVQAVYKDPADIATACIGHVSNELKLGQTFTATECAEKFGSDLEKHNAEMQSAVSVELTEPENMAYTSFHFNVGGPNFKSSTLLKLLNSGHRIDACIELTHACSDKTKKCGGWTYSDGVQYPGLVNRRRIERNICLLGAINAENVYELYQSMGYSGPFNP